MEYKIGSTVFDDWVITQELGEGSFGHAYKIEKNDFNVRTASALKIISVPQTEAAWTEALVEGVPEEKIREYYYLVVSDFIREVAFMNTVKSHPNIVSIEDYSVIERESGMGWVILIRMELLTTLSDYLHSHPAGPEVAVKVGMALCSALQLCEQKQLIHRDIKPANIFISEAGFFKLGDFGIARTASQTMGQYTKGAGTPAYEAPEVYLGKPYGKTADIYSVGLVMYELLNYNALPFLPRSFAKGVTRQEYEAGFIRRLKGEAFPSPALGSPPLWDIIRKACVLDPTKRYQSAGEMLRDLKSLTGQGMVRAAEGKEKELKHTGGTPLYAGISLYPANRPGCYHIQVSGTIHPDTGRNRLLFNGVEPLSAETFLKIRKQAEAQRRDRALGISVVTVPGCGTWNQRKKLFSYLEKAGIQCRYDMPVSLAQTVDYVLVKKPENELKILSVAVRSDHYYLSLTEIGDGLLEVLATEMAQRYYASEPTGGLPGPQFLQDLCLQALKDSGCKPSDIGLVLYSENVKMEFIPFLKSAFFSARVLQTTPEAAARGCAAMSRRWSGAAGTDLLVLRTVYHSIYAGEPEGRTVCMIDKNSTIPIRQTESFVIRKNVKEWILVIYEGQEFAEGKPKEKIDEYRITGFSVPDTKDLEVEVTVETEDWHSYPSLFVSVQETKSGTKLQVTKL